MRTTISHIKEMKRKGEPVVMLTAYDYPTAKVVDQAGVPLILVGDSLGMVALGYETTIPVTMTEMLHHTKAVVRGSRQALIIGDMPFMSYHLSADDALRNAARFIQEAGAQAVKLEGGVDCHDAEGNIYQVDLMLAGTQERDYKKDSWPEKTWWTLHRAAFGGDVCPIKIKGHGRYRKSFVARAKSKKVDLDPDGQVSLEMLGKAVPFDQQWELVLSLDAQFEPLWEEEVEPVPETVAAANQEVASVWMAQ